MTKQNKLILSSLASSLALITIIPIIVSCSHNKGNNGKTKVPGGTDQAGGSSSSPKTEKDKNNSRTNEKVFLYDGIKYVYQDEDIESQKYNVVIEKIKKPDGKEEAFITKKKIYDGSLEKGKEAFVDLKTGMYEKVDKGAYQVESIEVTDPNSPYYYLSDAFLSNENYIRMLFPVREEFANIQQIVGAVFPTLSAASSLIRRVKAKQKTLSKEAYKTLFNRVYGVASKAIHNLNENFFDGETNIKNLLDNLRIFAGIDLVRLSGYDSYALSTKDVVGAMKSIGKPSGIPLALLKVPFVEEGDKYKIYHIDQWEEEDVHVSNNVRTGSDGKDYRSPSYAWSLNRVFIPNNTPAWSRIGAKQYRYRMDSELFLSRQFFEKNELNKTKDENIIEVFSNDWLTWLYSNTISALLMSKLEAKVLETFLEKENVLVNGLWEKDKNFKDNAYANGYRDKIGFYENALLDYITVKDILGMTVKETAKVQIQMFPGSQPYYGNYKTDFTEFFFFAAKEYYDEVAPVLTVIDTLYNRQNTFKLAFLDKYKGKRDMVYAFLKQAYGHFWRTLDLPKGEIGAPDDSYIAKGEKKIDSIIKEYDIVVKEKDEKTGK
ncbi:MAG3960 family lipoprotein [Ureaplasma canigenitalium]|uniref:MAG3960 family lipoprotein n=1 Tax=Ureaplasma canigenitalium TaxID=42092 RepID=UPI0004E1B3BF|nr:hypothetical protein [Ureaplasma canigenitalium]